MYICRVEDRIGNGYIPGSRDDIASYFFLEKQGFHARGVTDGPSRRLRAGHGGRERATANRFRTDRQTQSQPHARGCSSLEIKQVK